MARGQRIALPGCRFFAEPYARHLARKFEMADETGAADLHQHGVADQADGQAFEFEGFSGVHDDGLEIWVLGE